MEFDTNINSPVEGSCRNTTYMVYIDDSGDKTQDLIDIDGGSHPLLGDSTLQQTSRER